MDFSKPITIESFTEIDKDLQINSGGILISSSYNDYEEEETIEGINDTIEMLWINVIDSLEAIRKLYIKTGDERYKNELIKLLPRSYKEKI